MLMGMIILCHIDNPAKVGLLYLFVSNGYGMFQSYGVGSSLFVSSTGKFEGPSEEQATMRGPRFFCYT